MEYLNKSLQQTIELFRSLTPTGRLTAGLLIVAILISLAFLFRFETGGLEESFLNGATLSRSQIAALEAAFAKQNLGGSRVENNRIFIPRGKKIEYLTAAAADDALPHSMSSYLMDALNDVSSLGSQRSDVLKQRVNHARELMLGRIISEIKGIEEASVHFDEVTIQTFPRKMKKTAVVGVRALDSRDLTPQQVRAIRETVTAYFVGLERAAVTVTDLNGVKVYNPFVNGDTNLYFVNKQMYEREWRNKIYERLAMYEGVVVQVNVDLDSTGSELRGNVRSRTPINMRGSERKFTSGWGRSGHGGLSVGNQGRAIGDASNQSVGARRVRPAFSADETPAANTTANLTPKNVRVSIAVPTDLFIKIWQTRNTRLSPGSRLQPDPAELLSIEQQTLQSINDAVTGLLPATDPLGQAPSVTITTHESLAATPSPEPTRGETASAWLADNWRELGLIMLALVSLLVVRRVAISKPETAEANSDAFATYDDEGLAIPGSESLDAGSLKQRFQQRTPDLRAQLSEIVREDPDAAANVLRTWIGESA